MPPLTSGVGGFRAVDWAALADLGISRTRSLPIAERVVRKGGLSGHGAEAPRAASAAAQPETSTVVRTAWGCALLAALYWGLGRLGLMLDPVAGFATLVWPPAGIALAALVLYGTRLWPGIAAGAFLTNVTQGAPATVALAISVGNTLGPLVGATLLRAAGFSPSLGRYRDVIVLALTAAACALVSATWGVASLFSGGVIASDRLGQAWTAWWLGDSIGILTVAPAVLVWLGNQNLAAGHKRIAEAILLAASILIVGWLSFHANYRADGGPLWSPYMLSPLLIWAALRFEQRGASLAIVLVSAIAVSATALGGGPFQGGPLNERLRSLEVFMAVVSVTFLVLGAVTIERRVATERAEATRDAAEAASRTKTQFLALMSHELRTPLSAIIGYASLIEDGIPGPVTQGQRDQIGRIKGAAWHLVEIIDSILTLARSDAGREIAKFSTVDPVAVVREAWALVATDAARQGMTLELAAPDRPVTLQTDPGKLRQILLNLFVNAVKFAERGAVEVTVQADAKELRISVRDHGPGIPPEAFERIFEPFTQLDQSDTRSRGGTGLGLAVARSFAGLLGGTLGVASAPGSGSVFTLTLGSERQRVG